MSAARGTAHSASGGRPIVWVHGDALGPEQPALSRHPGAPAIFVFDDVVIEGYQLSLKRLVFLYECLLDLPVTIRRGDVAEEVLGFAAEHGASRIVTTWTPAPRFRELADRIAEALPVEVLTPEPFVALDRPPDLRRFSRYWRRAERPALRLDETRPLLPGFEEA